MMQQYWRRMVLVGLSYSQFKVSWASEALTTATVSTDDMHASHAEYFSTRARGDSSWSSPASYAANITNTGSLSSDFVLLGFVSSPTTQLEDPQEPLRELFDFARVSLLPKESVVVHLSVPASVLSHVDERGNERYALVCFPCGCG
jgi:hypothetical protein